MQAKTVETIVMQYSRLIIAASLIISLQLHFNIKNSYADETTEATENDEGPWIFTGFFSQQLNQVSFSNWVQGGDNSFASTSLVNLSLNYKKERFVVENRLNLAYGILKIEDRPLRKNEDRIHFLSKGGREVSQNLSTSYLLDFRTQFTKGYKYESDETKELVSNFMAPGNLSLSFGLDYKPLEYLSIFFSPASGRLIFVRDQDLANAGAYGVKPAEYDDAGNMIKEGENLNAEFGILANIMFSKEVYEDIMVESRLTLFNNLVDDDKSNRKNTDVDWETSINIKINRYITASFHLHLLYDHDTIKKTQTKQLLGIGLSYRI